MPEKSETTLKFWNIRKDEANDTALVKQQLCDKDMKVPSKLLNSQAYAEIIKRHTVLLLHVKVDLFLFDEGDRSFNRHKNTRLYYIRIPIPMQQCNKYIGLPFKH